MNGIPVWYDVAGGNWRWDYTAPNGNSINIAAPTLEQFVVQAKADWAALGFPSDSMPLQIGTSPAGNP